MKFFRSGWIVLTLGVAGLFAQESHQITVREMITDPGLNSRAHLSRKFTWSADGKTVYYLGGSASKKRLLSITTQSLQVDTVLKSEELVWSDSEQSVRLDISEFIESPSGGQFLLTGNNDLFLYTINDSSVIRLTTDGDEKDDFKFAPNGKWISYIREHNLWIVNCATANNMQLTTDGQETLLNGEPDWMYSEEFDLESGYCWSPDSRMIAYIQLNEKGVSRHPLVDYSPINPTVEWQFYPVAGESIPEAKVIVVNIASKNNVWLTCPPPKSEYIARIDWLTDTSLVVIQSINRLQNHKKILYGNPFTGETKVILEKKDPYWSNVTNSYRFLKKTRDFIYYSELEGYLHLYLHKFTGEIIKPITSGNWMVTELNGVDEDNQRLYFTSTRESVLERHIYCADLNTGNIIRIDSTEGEHSVCFNKDFTYYLDFYSKINSPVNVNLHKINGQKVVTLYRNKEFSVSKYNFGSTKFIKIASVDGDSLNASLLFPSNFDPQKKYPVMVYIYGGPGVQIVKNRYSGVWHQILAQQGYLVFSLDNRGSYGRGRNWERRIYQQLGKLELQDQLDGIKYLKSLAYVDPNRIGIWGTSYGGYMTLYALSRAPEIFKTGVAVAPVTNWKYYDAIYTERYMGLPKDHQMEYRNSSPINYVDQIKVNFLLIHGTYDDNVHLQQSLAFINEMIKKSKHFEMLFYPGRRHGISDQEGQIHMYEDILNFIKRNL